MSRLLTWKIEVGHTVDGQNIIQIFNKYYKEFVIYIVGGWSII